MAVTATDGRSRIRGVIVPEFPPYYPPEQWKSIRTTNAIERLHDEFKRRIKTQCLLPCAETACMLFWALLASGQITLRRIDGWDTFHVPPTEQNIDLAA